jgi:hypothetical protein
MQNKEIILEVFEKLFKNNDARASVVKIAIKADAKLGFPTVPITALYGLFHCTKSLPEICISP